MYILNYIADDFLSILPLLFRHPQTSAQSICGDTPLEFILVINVFSTYFPDKEIFRLGFWGTSEDHAVNPLLPGQGHLEQVTQEAPRWVWNAWNRERRLHHHPEVSLLEALHRRNTLHSPGRAEPFLPSRSLLHCLQTALLPANSLPRACPGPGWVRGTRSAPWGRRGARLRGEFCDVRVARDTTSSLIAPRHSPSGSARGPKGGKPRLGGGGGRGRW